MRILLGILAQTLRTLWSHKLRSFLTMFGIAWGVGSLLLLVGLGEGFRSGNRKQFEELGENVMFVFAGRAPAIGGSFTGMRQCYLTDNDYRQIREEASDVKACAPAIMRSDIRAVREFSSSSGQITGVPTNFNQIRYLPVSGAAGSMNWMIGKTQCHRDRRRDQTRVISRMSGLGQHHLFERCSFRRDRSHQTAGTRRQ